MENKSRKFASILARSTIAHKDNFQVPELKRVIIMEIGPHVNKEVEFEEFARFFTLLNRQTTTYGVLKCCLDTVNELMSVVSC